MPNIDLHHHIYIPEVEEVAAAERRRRPQHADSFENFFPPVSAEYNRKMTQEKWGRQLRDAGQKLADMKADRLDMALVSPPPPAFCYWITGKLGEEVARITNDGVAAFCKKDPAHFRGLANVPLQNGGEAAAAELERAMKGGLLGCIIPDRVGPHALDEPQYEAFWAAAERLGAFIFIHPDFADFKPLYPYYMANCVGNPLATTVAAARLILSGHFERYPGLQVMLAHAGGNLPWAVGRIQHAWEARPETKVHTPHPPRHYFKNLYFDVITFSQSALRWMVEELGADRVVCGTDYPYDMMQERVVDFVEGAGLSAADQEKVLRSNPARLIKL
ncbi:MAG: amidohydrolase [Candidatus Tectomicrobia bacterium]|uniref:Amidohydrolase n=1 Tax=Tectimicrobiota bacterium TaxID=2528274 RepID=A0A932HYJ8_UNCTE|nr:amidohydrolase [Candidatus Tectomicrobia bacterium]